MESQRIKPTLTVQRRRSLCTRVADLWFWYTASAWAIAGIGFSYDNDHDEHDVII